MCEVRAAAIAKELAESHAGEKSLVSEVADSDGKCSRRCRCAQKQINGNLSRYGGDGNGAIIASVPSELASRFSEQLIQEVARSSAERRRSPENARGAGNDPTKIEEALARAGELIEKSL